MPEAPEATAELTEEEKWLQTLPEALRPTAQRHGRPLFEFTMRLGAVNHALGILQRQGRGNRAVGQALFVLQGAMDALAKGSIAGMEKQVKDYLECKEDIERAAALADPATRLPSDRVSKGGIILDS